MMKRFLLGATILALLTLPGRRANADDVYCGIYAVYGAASVVRNTTAEFEQLIDVKYVSTRYGSKISDLIEAGRELGVTVSPLQGLGIASLHGAQGPLILHVAAGDQLVEYNHWILFLGIENGQAHIVDSIDASRHVPISAVLARWDGVALAVTQDQDSVPDYSSRETAFMVNRLLRACFIVILVSLLVSLVFAKRFAQSPGSTMTGNSRELTVGAMVLVGSCLVHAGFSEVFDGQSLSRNRSSAMLVQAAARNGEFPLIDYTELMHEISESPEQITIVDARPEYLYRQGAIPGAINIPIDGKHQEMIRRLEDIDRTKPVVLYCQSKGCAFDEKLAIRLAGTGFTHIRLYQEGWNGWRRKSMLNR